MCVMTSQILKFVDFTKTEKPRYFENKTFFSSNKKIHQFHIDGYFMAKNTFAAEVTIKKYSALLILNMPNSKEPNFKKT